MPRAYFCMLLLLVTAIPPPAAAQQQAVPQTFGAIYYSPAGHRIGWSKNLPDADTATHAAQAFCQGGEIDDDTMQLLDTKQGGIDVTLGDATDIKTAVNDCIRVITLGPDAANECGGFAYDYDGTYSSGVNGADAASVKNKFAAWDDSFVACNGGG